MSGQYSRTRNLILTLILTRTRTHTLNFAAITPMSENTPKNQQKFLDGEMYLRIYVSEGYETGKCSVRARGRHAGSPSCISLSPLLATPLLSAAQSFCASVCVGTPSHWQRTVAYSWERALAAAVFVLYLPDTQYLCVCVRVSGVFEKDWNRFISIFRSRFLPSFSWKTVFLLPLKSLVQVSD